MASGGERAFRLFFCLSAVGSKGLVEGRRKLMKEGIGTEAVPNGPCTDIVSPSRRRTTLGGRVIGVVPVYDARVAEVEKNRLEECRSDREHTAFMAS